MTLVSIFVTNFKKSNIAFMSKLFKLDGSNTRQKPQNAKQEKMEETIHSEENFEREKIK